MFKYIFNIFITFILVLNCEVRASSSLLPDSTFYLRVEKIILESGQKSIYVIVANNIVVYKTEVDKFGEMMKKRIYKHKLNETELDSLHLLVRELYSIDSSYSKAMLGGVRMNLDLYQGEENKSILIENINVKEVNTLLNLLNKFIPTKKQIIRNSGM